MFTWLKRHLIPHTGNNHQPYLLHGEGARTTVIMVLLFELFVFLLPSLTFYQQAQHNLASVLPAVLGTLTNEERTSQHLGTLIESPELDRAAQMKADDMAANGYFAHTSPDGKTPWYWLKSAGYDYQYAGENLAINFNDSKDVTEAWMNSPTHRANIIKGAYTEIGTGVATGMYQGRETVFVAQVYASPLKTAATAPQPIVSQPAPAPSAAIAPIAPITNVLVVAESIPPQQDVLGAEAPEETAVTSADLAAPTNATPLDRAMASPTHTANTILIIVGSIVLAVMLLTAVVTLNKQHPDLLTNGLAVVAVIGGIVVSNTFLSSTSLQTSQIEYSLAEQTASAGSVWE